MGPGEKAAVISVGAGRQSSVSGAEIHREVHVVAGQNVGAKGACYWELGSEVREPSMTCHLVPISQCLGEGLPSIL